MKKIINNALLILCASLVVISIIFIGISCVQCCEAKNQCEAIKHNRIVSDYKEYLNTLTAHEICMIIDGTMTNDTVQYYHDNIDYYTQIQYNAYHNTYISEAEKILNK